MKTQRLRAVLFLCLLSHVVTAQQHPPVRQSKQGKFVIDADISQRRIDSFNQHTVWVQRKTIAVWQFEKVPGAAVRAQLQTEGVTLLNYIPKYSYTVGLTKPVTQALLQQAGVRGLTVLSPQQKLHPELAQQHYPSWAVKKAGTVDVQLLFAKTFSLQEMQPLLVEKQAVVLPSPFIKYQVLSLRVPTKALEAIAALPFVLYIKAINPPNQPLNFNSRVSSRGAILNMSAADGGRGLNGEGIVVGVGDDGDVQTHVDFSGRLIDRSNSGTGVHATHTHGTVAGAGIVDPKMRGYAPKATIVSQDFTGILENAPVYVADYNMVVTNNSYGPTATCTNGMFGAYDYTSYILDQQAFDMPHLQQVFSSGNSGAANCGYYPAGYHTVLSSFQSAKNVLTIGNSDYNGFIYSGSSRGPVDDGRIKPEIAALGVAVRSSVPTNSYSSSTGTSHSAPAVSGGLALLYQRYRQLHANADPQNALMKALVCNGATDQGQPGPDYAFGFGFMNLERSVQMLENNQYILGNLVDGETTSHSITIPPNTAQVKVMLYWNDPASVYVMPQTLVNDLDLTVVKPSSSITYPKILDTSRFGVTLPATEGEDHINNIEQVVIDNPAAGTYTINVAGTVAFNPSQDYVIVYDIVSNGMKLSYPCAGAQLSPGEATNIAWDAVGNGINTFDLDYTTDNGSTWNSIATNVNAAARSYAWSAPALNSTNTQVRIKENNTVLQQSSAPFTILGVPVDTLNPVQCEGYISIGWHEVKGATDYEVMLLRGTDMMPVAITSDSSYTFNSLSKDSVYWVSVRARLNGKPGRRALAISRQPNSGTCSNSISDNDLKLVSIDAPISGRWGTSTQLSMAAVKISIKNIDDAPATSFTLKYRINNGVWVFENVSTTINAGATYTHTFSNLEDFSATGTYVITAVVTNNQTDLASGNDTFTTIIKHLPNAAIDLTTAFVDDLEGADASTYTTSTIGLNNLERYDYSANTYGRLRTFVNSGVALTGNKSFAIDADRRLGGSSFPVQYLTGTYNLSNYNATVHDIRFECNSINGADANSTLNRVWIRGSDTQPWIEAFGPLTSGTSPGIEVSNLLAAQGQNFSSSFQIRWGIPASGQIISQGTLRGLLLDDIKLMRVLNDMEVSQIDAPTSLNCGLGNAVPVKITVRNRSTTPLLNVPVRYKIDNGAWVNEIIASVGAYSTMQYSFTTPANLSAPGIYNIAAEVVYPGDSYSSNNTATLRLYNSALITTFPYLENFESGNGGWYTEGTNGSWQYGTPASAKINSAASGTKAWKTRLNGNYNNNEYSFLYSPCFNIAGMTKPTLSLSVALDIENCGSTLCDGAWVEFSVDNSTWYNLADLSNTGTNWYKSPMYVWNDQNYTNWHVATMNLPTGYNTIRFRIVMGSDDGVTREGIAVDDIHVYNNTKGIYSGATLGAPVTTTVSGNNWIDFTSSGKLIASIQPNNQSLGITDVQAYINSGAVRNNSSQYYHNRNITIKPANRSLPAPATVRVYFLDSETNALIAGTGCNSCSSPKSAYELGVSKFTASNQTIENGTISDNASAGSWSFLTPGNVIKVPFDKGYYAEFQVQDFSEFWLSKGALFNITPLPVTLVKFDVKRVANNVLLQWQAGGAHNVNRYEVESISTAGGAFKQIGTVTAKGDTAINQDYEFSDPEPFTTGTRRYRLKIVDNDGVYKYSEVRTIRAGERADWTIYPNPSPRRFHLLYQANAGELCTARVQDSWGQTVKTYQVIGSGTQQKLLIDLSGFAAGIYLLEVESGGQVQHFKLIKNQD